MRLRDLKSRTALFDQVKTQKRLAHNNFVAIFQRLPRSRRESFPTVDKRAVGRTQIFKEILSVVERNARMTARDLRFRIVRIQIHVRKDSPVGIPASDVRLR